MSCPNCGFVVKAHFDRLKAQQYKAPVSNSIDAKIKSTEEKKFNQYKYEMEQKKKEIDKLECPQKPNFFLSLFRSGGWLSYFILVGPTVTLLFCKFAGVDFILLLLYIVLGYLATPIWLFICYGDYKSDLEDYKKELHLYETNKKALKQEKEYKKNRIEAGYRTRAHFEAEAEHRPPVTTQTPKITYPVCVSSGQIQRQAETEGTYRI